VKENENYADAANARRKWVCSASEQKKLLLQRKKFSQQKFGD
jgi:hypothetical protein